MDLSPVCPLLIIDVIFVEKICLPKKLTSYFLNHSIVIGFDPLSREEQAKKANRAQRFGGLPHEPSETKDESMEEAGMEVGT